MAATGSEIANAYVAITVKAPNIGKDIQKQLGGVDASGAGSQIGSKLAGGLKKSVKVGAAGVAATLGTALVKGFGRLKSIETAEAKMRGIGFTSKEVSGAMDNALASVKGTAFGLGEAATTASQLMAANIAPGEKLEGVLKTVANNAALAGTEFGEMGSIFAKAATQANGVQNDVISQLADRGIPIYKALGDQMGVTAGEVFKLASQGKIDFETFAAAAEAAAGTAAAEMGGTTTGAFDNMMAALGRLGAKILEDVYPLIGPLFGEITKWLDEVTPKVEPLVAVLGDKLKSAMQLVGGAFAWVKNNSTWLAPTAVAVGGMASAIWAWTTATKVWLGVQGLVKGVQAAYIAATYGQAGATYAAGGAQKFLNAAMKANPIMLIVTAIAGLVAGLVWFFAKTELGKKIWGEFTRFLSEAWANVSSFFQDVWNNVLKPVFEGIGEVLSFVWNSILKPVFDAIATVATWVFENILKPAFNGVQVAFAILGGIFQGIYDTILKPVFDAIGAIVGWLWTNIVQPYFGLIKLQFQVLGAVVKWLWLNVVQPVFNAIGAIFTWIYQNIIAPIITGIKAYFNVWATVMIWLWQNAIKPAIDGIAAVFQWVYNSVIKPVWNWIAGIIRSVWEGKIKPVIDTLVRVIKSDPKKAFEAARDAIGKAWKGIQDLAKKPVVFVVETVLGGLVKAINKIPGVELPVPKLPKGFARGGVLPGYQPQKKDELLVPMRKGEGVLVPEVVRGLGKGTIDALNAAGNAGGVQAVRARFGEGLARGGYVNPLKPGSYSISQPFHAGHNGIDLAAPTGTPVYAATTGRITHAGWHTGGGGNQVQLMDNRGVETWYAHLSRITTRLGATVKQGRQIGAVGSTGNSTGPHLHYMVMPGGWPNYINPAPYMSGATPPGGYKGGGWNPLAGIVDSLMEKVKKAFPGGGLWVDAAAGLAKQAAQAAVKAFLPKIGKDDGVGSATLYDSGGWLMPGKHLVENRSGRPEPILTAAQWDALLDNRGGIDGSRFDLVLDNGERLTGFIREVADEAIDDAAEQSSQSHRFAAI